MTEGQELEALFLRMPVSLYRSSPDGRLLDGNEALANLLGYDTVEEMRERLHAVGSVYVDAAARQRWLDEMAREDIVREFEIEFIRTDGTRLWVQDTARAIRDSSGEILYCEGVLIDVTEKVRARRERDEFLATVAHELRNPISVMLGLGSELAVNYDRFDDSDRRDLAHLIARQADDAAWLIEDLLVAYRDDLSAVLIVPEDIDLVKVAERVLEVVDQPIDVQVSGSSWVSADPRRCRQIVRNLISNAVRHGGSRIWVEITGGEGVVGLTVSDGGGPIPHADRERIFEPFQRGGTDTTSVGLGLSVGRRLARLMGGDLVLHGDAGVTSFVLTLPSV